MNNVVGYLVSGDGLLAVGALRGGVDADGGEARGNVPAQLLEHDRRTVDARRLRVGEGLVENVLKSLG